MSRRKADTFPGMATDAELAAAELGGGDGASGIQYVDVQLNNDQILNLKASKIEVLAAPGAGLAIVPSYVYAVADIHTAFTGGVGGTALIQLFTGDPSGFGSNWDRGNDSNAPFSGISANLKFGSQVGTVFGPILWNVDYDGDWNNLPLYLGNRTDDEFGGGDPLNTLSLRIWYSIVPTVPFGA